MQPFINSAVRSGKSRMLNIARHSRKIQRGALVLILCAGLLYAIYVRKPGILSLPRRNYTGVQKCKLKWNNPKVSVEFYEAPTRDLSKIVSKDDFLTRPIPVKSLFPDPVIQLNPDKFLLPIVYNGPNNQITGLREATFVAIKLNRTVVIPRFFKHFSDSSVTSRREWFLFPGHRISIEDYCKFVSCVTIQQFQEACGRQIDSLFHLQPYKPNDIRDWESYTGMRISRTGTTDGELNVKLIPPDPLPPGERHRKFKPKDIQDVLASKDRCVLYPRPLYNLHLHAMVAERDNFDVKLVQKQEDIYKLPDSRLFLSICNATNSPQYIRNLAKDFVRMTIKRRPFLSVHWRYNKDDFMKRCKSNSGNKLKMQMCANAMSIKPENIANSIEMKVEGLREKHNLKISDVYIASPPSERKLIEDIAILLYERHGWLTHSSLDLEKYVEERYSNCEIMQKHFNDILSTTEMKICGLGTTFLGSARSSWSDNVHLLRKAHKENWMIPEMDGDIYRLSISMMGEDEEGEEEDEQS